MLMGEKRIKHSYLLVLSIHLSKWWLTLKKIFKSKHFLFFQNVIGKECVIIYILCSVHMQSERKQTSKNNVSKTY